MQVVAGIQSVIRKTQFFVELMSPQFENEGKTPQKRTIAAIPQVGPDDLFLRETERAQSATLHGGVNHHPGVRHQSHPFIQPHSGRCVEEGVNRTQGWGSENSRVKLNTHTHFPAVVYNVVCQKQV